jgi:hypothetical protein
MTTPEIAVVLFDDMNIVRSAVVSAYEWFTHDTALKHLPLIRKHGLLPHLVNGAPDAVIERLGCAGRHIVCVHPVGADLIPQSSQQRPYVRLAVRVADLPQRVGLDWSYGCWELAQIIKDDSPHMTGLDISKAVIRRRGSLISYDPIGVSTLRVCCNRDQSYTPAPWPMLADATDDKLAKFE